MSDMEITIKLPEELIERAHAAGVDFDSLTPRVAELIERQIERKQALRELLNIAEQLEGSMTQEQIDAELDAAKAARIAEDSYRQA